MQKMNEYYLQKQHDKHEKERKEAKRRESLQQQRGGGRGRGRARMPSGTYSKDFAKVNYRDKDMNTLANDKKGTTNAYNYQDFGMPDLMAKTT
jgi:hypothetical protein